jgi:hypothetical protein
MRVPHRPQQQCSGPAQWNGWASFWQSLLMVHHRAVPPAYQRSITKYATQINGILKPNKTHVRYSKSDTISRLSLIVRKK